TSESESEFIDRPQHPAPIVTDFNHPADTKYLIIIENRTSSKAGDSSSDGPHRVIIILGCITGVLVLAGVSGGLLLLWKRRRRQKSNRDFFEHIGRDSWSISPYPTPGAIFVAEMRPKDMHEGLSNEPQRSESRGSDTQDTDEASEARTSSSTRLQKSILRELRELRALLRGRRTRPADSGGSSGQSGTASRRGSLAGTMPPPYSEAL
ncbi:hypothetical protein V5O48_013153, partial [Marasmius crinis-equi]